MINIYRNIARVIVCPLLLLSSLLFQVKVVILGQDPYHDEGQVSLKPNSKINIKISSHGIWHVSKYLVFVKSLHSLAGF